jgi:acetyl esterase/lipase
MGLVRQMASSGKVSGLNESKIGFMGFSAGAHLTGHLNVKWEERTYSRVDAADDKPCRPDFAMMVYVRVHASDPFPPAQGLSTSFTQLIGVACLQPWESVTEAPVSASKEQASALNVTKSTPPTMIIQAEDDPVHCENALFCE